QLGRFRRRKSSQSAVYFFSDRIQISRIAIKGFYTLSWNVILKQTVPLVQARSRGCRRILGIQRQQHNFIACGCSNLLNGFALKRMPVSHRNEAAGIDSRALQLLLQPMRLPLSMWTNRRTSADDRIVVLHFPGTSAGDQLGEWFTSDTGKREVNNVRVAKEVI